MFAEGLIDLDELVLHCRDEKARSFIEEAVRCYKAGAFRQTIVATWIAVVYDIIDKLRQLDLTGDANASKFLEEYERIREADDIRGSLEFERKILRIAKVDFGLISEIEYVDLSRIQDDRNRCAHPALNALDEVYRPSAELARTHLRNAIEHLLQYQAVQGKAAMNRLLAEVQSAYFPVSSEDAINYFSKGPLSRPRDSLVRDFTIVALKALLLDELDTEAERRWTAALQAIRAMQREHVEATFVEKLNELMLRIPDSGLHRALRLLREVADIWQYLKNDSWRRLENYVRALPAELLGKRFVDVFAFPPFVSDEGFRDEIIDAVVFRYINAASFDQANNVGVFMIVPCVKYLRSADIARIIQAAAHNPQITASYQRNNVLNAVKAANIIATEQFEQLLDENGL